MNSQIARGYPKCKRPYRQSTDRPQLRIIRGNAVRGLSQGGVMTSMIRKLIEQLYAQCYTKDCPRTRAPCQPALRIPIIPR